MHERAVVLSVWASPKTGQCLITCSLEGIIQLPLCTSMDVTSGDGELSCRCSV